jgi:hypothetical protein
MANTRNHNVNNDNNQGNPPPPPTPTLEQVLIMQAQILQTMQQTMAAQMLQTMEQTMANMQNAQGNHVAQQQQPQDKLGEFHRTKLPTFSHSVEPMDADELLRMIEKKLQVV